MTDMTVERAMQLADLLYSAGYDARHKERDYDPRGCDAWQDVVDALTATSVDAERWRQAFVNERVDRYREDGMKVEQARIHAETDAAVAMKLSGRLEDVLRDAESTLTEVIERFPNTDAARTAKDRLYAIRLVRGAIEQEEGR